MREKEKLRYLAKKVVENEEIWVGFEKGKDRNSSLMIFDIPLESKSVLPVWPTKELAELYFRSDKDFGYEAGPLNLFSFLDDVIPEQLINNSKPGAFFNENLFLNKGWTTIKQAIFKELLCGQYQKDADPSVVFNALGRGEISEASASYALHNLIDKEMDFNEREIKALRGAASLKTISKYAANGWPTNCDICGIDIDYSSDWDVGFNQKIVCQDCFEKFEKENLSTRIILDDEDAEILEHMEKNGYDEKKNIEVLRKIFTENKDWRVDKISRPDWAEEAVSSPMLDEAEALYNEGKIVYACIFMVNELLFSDYRPACDLSNPGYVVYSLDPYYDDHPDELLLISNKIYSYRDKKIVPLEMQKFVEVMENESNSYFNLLIPLEMTDGREVLLTATLFQRNHLPMLKINGRILPVFADNEKFTTCLPVPKRHFPKEMLFFVATKETSDYDDEEDDEDDDE